jgi:HrpA-like RNA helicase
LVLLRCATHKSAHLVLGWLSSDTRTWFAGLPARIKRRRATAAFGRGESTRLRIADAAVAGSAAAEEMRRRQDEQLRSASAQKMLAFRKKLPSFGARGDVLGALRNNQARSILPVASPAHRTPCLILS